MCLCICFYTGEYMHEYVCWMCIRKHRYHLHPWYTFMYVCVYVCTCISDVCSCIHVYMRAYIYMHEWIYILNLYVYIYIYIYHLHPWHMFVCVCICVHAFVHVCMCISDMGLLWLVRSIKLSVEPYNFIDPTTFWRGPFGTGLGWPDPHLST